MTEPSVQTVALEKLRIALQKHIIRYELEHVVDADAYIDQVAHRFVMEMNAYYWSDDLKQWTVRYPATWWDHVKQDLMPDWLQELWPVRYIVHEFSARVVYPWLSRRLPSERNATKIDCAVYEEKQAWDV